MICFRKERTGYRCWLALPAVIGLVLMFSAPVQAASNTGLHPTGYRPPTPEEEARTAPYTTKVKSIADLPSFCSLEAKGLVSATATNLPSKVANLQYLPVVGCQAWLDCGSFSPSYYLATYEFAKVRGWPRPDPSVNPERVMSPGFAFQIVGGGTNDGASLGAVPLLICQYGIATWKELPGSADYRYYPNTEAIWRLASTNRGDRILQFKLSTDADVQAVKAYLASGHILATGSGLLYSDVQGVYPTGKNTDNGVMYGDGSVIRPRESGGGGHAYALIGYDDTKTYNAGGIIKQGAFLFVNSWGPGWGVSCEPGGTAGYCWFGYDYARTYIEDVLGLSVRENYHPTDYLVMEVEHSKFAEMSLSVEAGPFSGTITNAELVLPLPSFGMRRFSGWIAKDITDFAGQDPLAYWLSLYDASLPAVSGPGQYEGTISNARIVRDGEGTTLPVCGLPLKTVDNAFIFASAGYLQAEELLNPMLDLYFGYRPSRFSALWADVDNDGDPDLLLNYTQEGVRESRLFRNNAGSLSENGSGLPADAPQAFTRVSSIAAGDYDGDGYVDLAQLTTNGIQLLRNNYGKGFSDSGITMPAVWQPFCLFWVDYDGDGDVDLIAGSHVLINNRNSFVDSGLSLPGLTVWGDYNNDGLLDYVCDGTVYRHMPNGSFKAAASVLGGPYAWGDYNGDGLLDLAVGGGIYRNDGEAHTPAYQVPSIGDGFYISEEEKFELRLTLLPGDLPGCGGGGLDWMDVDNDGRLDVVGGGAQAGVAPIYDSGRAVVLRQRTPGEFVDVGGLDVLTPYLKGVRHITYYQGDISAVDLDNDGDLDLSLVGENFNGDINSSDMHPPACYLFKSVVADQAALRRPNMPPSTPGGIHVTESPDGRAVLAWSVAQDDHTPSASISYRVRVGTQPGACDVVSPAQALGHGTITHPWRIGSSYPFQGPTNWGVTPPGPPAAELVAQTNAPLGVRLRGLASGRYYWSVQAVDGSRAASPWSGEHSFSWGGTAVLTGDINGDGVVDAADLVLCRRMVAGKTKPNLATADMDGNGRLDDADVRLLAKPLLGLTSGTNYLPLATAQIGPAGGRLATPDFELIVPPGAFLSNATLTIGYSCEQPAPGAPASAPVFQVTGIPSVLATSLVVRVPDGRTSFTNPVQMALGQWLTSSKDRYNPRLHYQCLAGAKDADGMLRFNVMPDQAAKFGSSSLVETTQIANAPLSLTSDQEPVIGMPPYEGAVIGMVLSPCNSWSYDGYKTGHFVLRWPNTWTNVVCARDLILDFEDAYSFFRSYYPTLDDFRDLATMPLDVYLVERTEEGELCGNNPLTATIEIRRESGTDPAKREMRRTTVYHEMFHLVQDILCMRPGILFNARASAEYIEAADSACTWVERFATTNASYIPELWTDEKVRNLVFDGYSYSRKCAANTSFWSWDRINKTGYAFSSLLIYFEQRFGAKYVFDIFNRIAAGTNHEDAVIGSLPTADMSWHNDFYRALVRNTSGIWADTPVYQLLKGKCQWPDLTADLSEAGYQPAARFRIFLPGLGAYGYRLSYPSNLVATAKDGGVVFALHNERYQDEDLSVFRTHDYVESNADSLGGTNYTASPGVKRYFLPGITNAFGYGPNSFGKGSFQHSLIALVVRSNPDRLLRDELYMNTWLDVGLARMGGSSNVISAVAIQGGWPLGDLSGLSNPYFPVFEGRSTVSFSNLVWTLTNREDVIVNGTYTTRWNEAHLVIWNDGPIDCPGVATFSPLSTTATYTDSMSDGHQVTYSPRTETPFVVDKYSATPDNSSLDSSVASTGLISRTSITGSNFVMRLDADETDAYFEVIRFYSIHDTNLRTGSTMSDTNAWVVPGLFHIERH